MIYPIAPSTSTRPSMPGVTLPVQPNQGVPSVSNVWSMWLRLSGEMCDALIAAMNRKASSRTLRLVSYERHTTISNARSAVMP
jgi:hypothetical protein